jgi:ABC-type branched-subunit amino acid transport system substrate-binding protein
MGQMMPKVKVAILLPLSGRNAPLGQAMLNAAQLAVFDVADKRFELMPRDTGSGEAEAETAARDGVASGAQLLIGPVFAGDVNRVKPVASMNGVNVLALSTDTNLADQNVFVMGFSPGAQVDRAVSYAHAHGLHRFAVLAPRNPYGNLVSEAFQQAVSRAGDQIIAVETYDSAKRGGGNAVTSLAAHKDQIDALFVPEGGADLALIAGQLAKAGFDPKHTKLIGTGLWDTAEIGRSDFLIGGWYAAPDPRARQKFVDAYAKTYGQAPPRLVTLAYDATALAALLAKQGGRFDHTALSNPNGFAGIDGIFRLTNAGLVERGLAMLEVTPKGGRVIEPAPATFTSVGL